MQGSLPQALGRTLCAIITLYHSHYFGLSISIELLSPLLPLRLSTRRHPRYVLFAGVREVKCIPGHEPRAGTSGIIVQVKTASGMIFTSYNMCHSIPLLEATYLMIFAEVLQTCQYGTLVAI